MHIKHSSAWQVLAEKLTFFTPYLNMPVSSPLAEHLFHYENETVAECVAELNNTLNALHAETDMTKAEWLSDKFIAQFHALHLLVIEHQKKSVPTHSIHAEEFKTNQHDVNQHNAQQRKNAIQQKLAALPPRERLTQYYEFLRRLNEMSDNTQAALSHATDDRQRSHLQTQLEQLQQRKARCQESIENLEAYLALES